MYKISYYNLCITYECRVRECQNLWNIHSTEMSIHRTKNPPYEPQNGAFLTLQY